MKKYTSNYCKSNSNFVINGIENKNIKVKYLQSIKIVKNIITRGNPTYISKFLKSYYKDYDLNKDSNFSLISKEPVYWNNTIKGSTNEIYNPALDFFENILEEYLGEEYSFIKKLILPEAKISEIVEKQIKQLEGMMVDFYLPQVDLVIEIDGYQHKYTRIEDKTRDIYQNKKVIRIETGDIRNKTDVITEKMNEIKAILDNSQKIQEYKLAYNYDIKNIKSKIELIQINRIQITILELLKNGYLNFTNSWNINILGVEKRVAILALDDLLNWFRILFRLQKINILIPRYNLNEDIEGNIDIDIDILKRYDETVLDNNKIFVRNDYFENEQKNYYQVECDDSYNYNLNYKNKYDNDNLVEFLQNIFGHQNFRDGQIETISNALNLRDTIGILPTGTGKSLCYQMVSLLQPGITFIICPLKSLIKDQKDNMDKIYINNTAKIDSTMLGPEKSKIIDNISKAKYHMVWVSPERFQSEDFRSVIEHINKNYNICNAIVDEVHCMSEWGHNFRTSYLNLIKTIRYYMPSVNLMGLTATASDRVLKDLKNEFEITDESNIITTLNFIRNELEFYVYNCAESQKKQILLEILDKLQVKRNVLEIKENENLSGIIFSPFASGKRGCIKLANDISRKFKDYKNNIGYFIGQNKEEETKITNESFEIYKTIVQDKFKNDEITLLLATKSFGMGIDKGNIRYIIHYGIPSSMESLYQEVGRAGRDGKKSICYIIHAEPEFSNEDEKNILFNTNSTVKQINEILQYKNKDNHKKNEKIEKKDNKIKYSSWGKGDIFDHMTFFALGQKVDEWEYIYNQYVGYIKGKFEFKIICKNEDELSLKEKAIYKLSLLGLVTDWTINYNSVITITGSCKNLSNEQIMKNIEKYINKYDYGFSFENLDEKKYRNILDILDKQDIGDIPKYIKIICSWYYENILYSRREAIEQIDNLMSSLNNKCTLEFNRIILDYFRPDDYALVLKYVSENPEEYTAVLKLFYENKEFINLDKMKSIKIGLGRLLVTNRFNQSLNLLDGLLKIYLGEFEEKINSEDFEYALEKIIQNDNKNHIYEEILKVSKSMTESSKNTLNKSLLKYFNTLKDLTLNYKYLETQNVLDKVLNINKNKILELERSCLNGTREDE